MSLTRAQVLALTRPVYDVHFRVFIRDSGDTAWQNMSDVSGNDFLVGVPSINEDIDAALMEAEFELAREAFGTRVNPIDNAALLEEDRRVLIETATMPQGSAPTAPDWVTEMEGRIRSINWGSNPVRVRCHDIGKRLQDSWIYPETIYGTDAGQPVQTVAANIITDHVSGSYPISTPVSPGFNIKIYEQGQGNVLSVIQELVLKIGWLFRYSKTTNQMTIYEIDRDDTTPDFTIPLSHQIYESDEGVIDIEVDDSTVRNRIFVIWDQETGSSVQYDNTSSQTKYGVRAMVFKEGGAFGLDTAAEATTFATAIGKDLGLPRAHMKIKIPFIPDINLGQLITFPAGKYFNSSIDFAVISIDKVLTPQEKSLTLTVRQDARAGAYTIWENRNVRPPKDGDFLAKPVRDTSIQGINFSDAVNVLGNGCETVDTTISWLPSTTFNDRYILSYVFNETTGTVEVTDTEYILTALPRGMRLSVVIIGVNDDDGTTSDAGTATHVTSSSADAPNNVVAKGITGPGIEITWDTPTNPDYDNTVWEIDDGGGWQVYPAETDGDLSTTQLPDTTPLEGQEYDIRGYHTYVVAPNSNYVCLTIRAGIRGEDWAEPGTPYEASNFDADGQKSTHKFAKGEKVGARDIWDEYGTGADSDFNYYVDGVLTPYSSFPLTLAATTTIDVESTGFTGTGKVGHKLHILSRYIEKSQSA